MQLPLGFIMNTKLPNYSYMLLVILIGVILPRIFLIGGYPMGDEGTYATFSLLQQAAPSSDAGTFALYPRLTSFVFDFDGNHIFYLRLIDLLVAILAAFLMISILNELASNKLVALLATILFLLVMNQFIFIHRGFSNSIYVAYVFLFGALFYLLKFKKENLYRSAFIIGYLIGVSVLFREPFVLFSPIIGLYLLIDSGFKAGLFYVLGGLISLVVAILVLELIGVSLDTIISSYVDLGNMYSQLRSNYSNINALNRFISATWVVLLFAFIVNAIYVFKYRGSLKSELWDSKWLLFLFIALVPLVEPLTKYSVPYTFALTLPGLFFATSIAMNALFNNASDKVKIYWLGLLIIPVLFYCANLVGNIPHKILWGGNFDGWSSSGFDNDRYLRASLVVARVSRAGDTVAMTGDLYPIFPVTVRAPIHLDMADLDRTVVQLDLTAEQLAGLLKQCTPDSIFLSSEQPKTSRIVAEAIELTDMYKLAARIESPSAGYGRSGAFVFRVKDEFYNIKTQKFCKRNLREYL